MTVNKSVLIHEIAQVKRELEQHKLQSRAEQCDANTSVQKLQEQTSELADVVKRLEQAYLNCPVPQHAQGFTDQPHHTPTTRHFQTQLQHPGATNLQRHDGLGSRIAIGKLFSTIKHEPV